MEMIQIDERVVRDAVSIMLESGVSYDSVHAACMKGRGLDTIITEDVKHWSRIKNIKVIRPLDYAGLVRSGK